jgi:hypothetical protein
MKLLTGIFESILEALCLQSLILWLIWYSVKALGFFAGMFPPQVHLYGLVAFPNWDLNALFIL